MPSGVINRSPSIRQRTTLGALLTTAAIAIVGSIDLIYPFLGDQALFTVGAKQISHGAMLYRDFWDLKQPGIYWFYLLAGRLFGFTEAGIHLGELLYFLALAALMTLTLRRYYHRPATAFLAAFLTVGVYFIVCGTWHLTQVEGLVAFPIFLCFWLSQLKPSNPPRPLRFFLMGVAAGVVVLFKMFLILLPISFLTISIFHQFWRQRRQLKEIIITILVPAAAGITATLLPCIVYFWLRGQLPLLYRTFFLYPPRIVAELPGYGHGVLRSGINWFLIASAPLLPFAACGAITRLRKERDAATIALISWFLLATLVVLIQRMWWQYHFLLPLFPLGLLAAAGFENILIQKENAPFRKSQIAFRSLSILGLTILLVPYLLRFSIKAARELRHGVPLTIAAQQQFRESISPVYKQARAQVVILEAYSHDSDPIYVLGDPTIYFLANRLQAVPINGWSPEWLLPEQWNELAAQLKSNRPAYIFVSAANDDILTHRGDAVMQVLNSEYKRISADSDGAWYNRSALGPSDRNMDVSPMLNTIR